MDLTLTVIGGKNAGRIIAIPGDKFLIGRAEDCHLRPNSDLVSRHHCAIFLHKGVATVRDFNSRNGTYLDDQRIEKDEQLHSGSRLRVGPLEFEISVGVNLAGQKKPKVQSLEEAAARTAQSASTPPAVDELDVAGWVAETAETDTQALNTAQTGTVAISTPPTDDTPASKDEQEKEEDPQGEKKKKPQPKASSDIHGMKKPKAADSQAAATETLRAFFNRK